MVAIPIGAAGQQSLLVTPELAIDFLGTDEARVLATPYLIGYLEYTARNVIKPYLGETEDSVGTDVSVRHLAATPVGLSVTFRAQVLEVSGRKVRFSVEASDEKEKIAEGTHERFVIDIPRFIAKLASKRSSV